MLTFIKLKALSQLSNRHLLHQPVTTSLSWVETFSPLNRNLLKLSDLSDELGLLGKFSSLLILSLLKSLLQITMNLIPDCLVLLLLENDLLSSGIFVGLDLSNDLLLLLQDHLDVLFTLLHHDFHLVAHLVDELMVLILFALSGSDSLLSSKFHFNLLFLDVLKTLDFILLSHLRFPAVEL